MREDWVGAGGWGEGEWGSGAYARSRCAPACPPATPPPHPPPTAPLAFSPPLTPPPLTPSWPACWPPTNARCTSRCARASAAKWPGERGGGGGWSGEGFREVRAAVGGVAPPSGPLPPAQSPHDPPLSRLSGDGEVRAVHHVLNECLIDRGASPTMARRRGGGSGRRRRRGEAATAAASDRRPRPFATRLGATYDTLTHPNPFLRSGWSVSSTVSTSRPCRQGVRGGVGVGADGTRRHPALTPPALTPPAPTPPAHRPAHPTLYLPGGRPDRGHALGVDRLFSVCGRADGGTPARAGWGRARRHRPPLRR